MKARVKEAELVLLYGLEETPSKEQKITDILKKLAMPYRALDDRMLGETLGYAAGLEGYGSSGQPYEGESIKREALLMKGLSEKRLNQLLSSLREAGASVHLKAVITKHNRDWKLYDLFHELQEEHDTIEAYHQLRRAYAAGCARDISSLSEPQRQEWSALLAACRELLESREPVEKGVYQQAAQRLFF